MKNLALEELIMDTEMLFPANTNSIDDLTILDYTAEEAQIIVSYIEMTRALQEIHQLFDVFRYHLSRLCAIYDLNASDMIVRKVPYLENYSDQTELNALMISYISSGKTLVDALQSCARETYNGGDLYNTFSKFISSIYDDSFSYRFLTRLRDFSQHGHLPVSTYDNRMCFDIAQIANTPHFRHNKSILEEMDNFCTELLEIQKVQPRYVFTLAVAEYTVAIHKIYRTFWEEMQKAFSASEKALRTLIKTYPNSIIHKNSDMDGYFFYIEDNVLHGFNSKEDSLSMVLNYTEEARQICDSEELELQEFRKSLKVKKLE